MQRDTRGRACARDAMSRFMLSARAYHRALKVARTIADLAGDARIDAAHAREALAYRRGLLAGIELPRGVEALAPPG